MAEFTKNLSIEKPAGNENFRREVINENMDKIDDMFGIEAGKGHTHDGTAGQGKKISYNALTDKPSNMAPSAHKATHAAGGSDALAPADIGAAAKAELDAYKADIEYQTPTIVGTQVQLTRQGTSKRLYFILANDLSGGNISISLDSGATLYPLKDVDGVTLTNLSKGYVEVVDNTSFFTLRPKGGEELGFFGKYAPALPDPYSVKYEGDILPSSASPSWSKTVSGSPTESTDGSYLTLSVPASASNIVYTRTESGIQASTTKRLRIRLKLNSGAGDPFCMSIADGSARLAGIRIFPNGTIDYSNSSSSYTNIITGLSFSSYTTIDLDFSSTFGIKVYQDGIQVGSTIAYAGLYPDSSTKTYQFSLFGGSATATSFSVDYVYYSLDINSAYIDRSTSPTTVVAAANDISGNGGRKVTRLSNGWFVAANYNSSTFKLLFEVSKDSGATWSELTYYNQNAIATSGFAITSIGTNVYTMLLFGSGSGNGCLRFDATTVGASVTYVATVDSSQTSYGVGCSIAVDSSGILHAAWSSKNSTYPNSFNIRYSKSSDGGTTWASPTQITIGNGANYNASQPCIVILNSKPYIIYNELSGSNSHYLNCKYYSGTAWVNSTAYIAPLSLYEQYDPCAVVSPDGVIHVVWSGADSTDTGFDNIRYSKSTDGGATWATAIKLTSGNSYLQGKSSITADKNNNIYVMWQGTHSGSTSYAQIRKIVYSGGAWGSIINVTSATAGEMYPQLCDNYTDFTDPLCIWRDNQTSSIKFRGIFTASQDYSMPLLSKVPKDWYVYSNEDVSLEFTTPLSVGVDHSVTTTVVASSAYNTSGNGGRKLTRLSNGWLVSAAFQTGSPYNLFFHVSKDNGATWTQLTYIGCAANTSFAIASYGTNIYMLKTSQSEGIAYFVKFDATASLPTQITAWTSQVDTSQSSFGSGCSIAVDSTGILHAAWVSKNATYPNSFNLRYSKSTDGGVTWAAGTQITNINITSDDITNPCIIMRNSTQPGITFTRTTSTLSQIQFCGWNGSNWTSITAYIVNVAQVQNCSCAVVSPDGNIHVVWQGLDSTDTTAANIRYSKSTDGGATWSVAVKLTTGNTYNQFDPNITADKNNNIYVIWNGLISTSATYTVLRKIVYSGGVWGSIVNLMTTATNNHQYQQTCANYTDFTDPIMVWKDTQATAIKFRGIWTDVQTIQYIPSIDNAAAESQLKVLGEGELKTSGYNLKRYAGIVSKKAKGWS